MASPTEATAIAQEVEKLLINGKIEPSRLRTVLKFEQELYDLVRDEGQGLKDYQVLNAGDVLWCLLSPPVGEEIGKKRPVVVLFSDRWGLFLVAALSRKPPNPIKSYHLCLPAGSIPGLRKEDAVERWLKGDAVYQVSRKRLDRMRTTDKEGRGIPRLPPETLKQVRACVLGAIGLQALTPHLIGSI